MNLNKDELLAQINSIPTDERKLEFLENELKKGPSLELKKIIMVLVAQIYERKKWYALAAKNYAIAGEIAQKFKERMALHMKEAENYILSNNFLFADDAFKKVIELASKEEKPLIKDKIKKLYFQQAAYLEKMNMQAAIKAYIRILNSGFAKDEYNLVIDKIAALYDKIGNPIEANKYRQLKTRRL